MWNISCPSSALNTSSEYVKASTLQNRRLGRWPYTLDGRFVSKLERDAQVRVHTRQRLLNQADLSHSRTPSHAAFV